MRPVNLRWPLIAAFVSCLLRNVSTAAEPGRPENDAAQGETQTLGIVLYPGFELLDVYGPAEVFGNVGKRLKLVTVAEGAGLVKSAQGPRSEAEFGFDDCPPLDLILVPGGFGTLAQLNNARLLDFLRSKAATAKIVMSVCSGSAILAKAGLLEGRQATSNKQYFYLAANQGKDVEWVKQARWVDAGDRVTSSGVSAGIDMSLAVVERLYGAELAQGISDGIEHNRHADSTSDPFAKFIKEPTPKQPKP